jgi:hypothetical protein
MMTKSILLFLIAFIFCNNANCQITKGNWLVGGSATFSRLQNSSTASAQFKQTNFEIRPLLGYFLKDKFAVGLDPSLVYGSNIINNSNNSSTSFSIGPFIRYYFLDTENMVNLFAQTGYDYYTITGKGQGKGQHLNTFSFSGGPVIYFNTSVGLEFIISYSTTKVAGFSGNNNKIQFGIGFQIHLEKE